jgi:GT2 family glycosyltransferase
MAEKNSSPGVAVILVNYDRHDDTIECIRSIQQSIFQPIQIVLVDNGSQPESVVKPEGLSGPAILRIEDNIKCAGGNNRGIEKARKRCQSLLHPEQRHDYRPNDRAS